MTEAYHHPAATNTITGLALEAAGGGRAVIPLAGKTPTTGATPHGVEDAAQGDVPVQQGHATPTPQQADTRPWWRRVFGG